MDKRKLFHLVIGLSLCGAALRFAHIYFDFDRESLLFANPSAIFITLSLFCIFVSLFFAHQIISAKNFVPLELTTPHLVAAISTLVLLLSSIYYFMNFAYSFLEGKSFAISSLLLLAFATIFPFYAVGMLSYFIKGTTKGMAALCLIPILSVLCYIIISYVAITEMSTTSHYTLLILSCCSLALFFFYAGKSLVYTLPQRPAALFGFLSAIFLTAEWLPLVILRPEYSSATMPSLIMGGALIFFSLAYSFYVYDN